MTQKTINTSSHYVNEVLSNAENCRNIDWDGYSMKFGDPGFTIFEYMGNECSGNNRPPGMPPMGDPKVCEWIKNNPSVSLPHVMKVSTNQRRGLTERERLTISTELRSQISSCPPI